MATFSERFDIFNAKISNRIESISKYTIIRDDFYNEIDHKFIRAGYRSAAIFYNANDLIVIFLIICLLQLILFTIKVADRAGARKARNCIMFFFLMYAYMRMSFLSMLNLRYVSLYNWESKLSLAIAGITATIVAGFPLFEAWNVRRYYLDLKSGVRPIYFRLNILYSDFKVNHPLQYAYYWQYFLRRFLFVAMIIGWPQEKFLTLSLSTIMHIMAMMYVTFLLPFNTRLQNVAAMVSEGGMVAIHGTLFPLLNDEVNTGLSHYKKTAIVFFLSVLIVL
jgi:hypothetical protein